MVSVYGPAGDRLGGADCSCGSGLRSGVLPLRDGQPGPGTGGARLPGVGRDCCNVKCTGVGFKEVKHWRSKERSIG